MSATAPLLPIPNGSYRVSSWRPLTRSEHSTSEVWVATLPTGMIGDDVALTAEDVSGTYDSSEMSPRDSIFRDGFE